MFPSLALLVYGICIPNGNIFNPMGSSSFWKNFTDFYLAFIKGIVKMIKTDNRYVLSLMDYIHRKRSLLGRTKYIVLPLDIKYS